MISLRLRALGFEQLSPGRGLLRFARGGGDRRLRGQKRLPRPGEGVAPLAPEILVQVREPAGLGEGGVETPGFGESRRFGIGGGAEDPLRLGEAGREAVRPKAREPLLQTGEDRGLLLPPRGARGLPLQGGAGPVDLADDVGEAQEVRARLLHLQLGLPFPDLVLRDAGRLLDQAPPVLGLRREDQLDLLLLDDRIGTDAETRPEKEVLDVAQPALPSVQDVVALAVAGDAAGDRHLAAGVGPVVGAARLQGQHHLGHSDRLSPGGAVEDHVLHRRPAEALGRLLAEDPLDGVRDVRLAGAVRPHDGGDPAGKRQSRPVDERLEALDLEFLQTEHSGMPPGGARR